MKLCSLAILSLLAAVALTPTPAVQHCRADAGGGTAPPETLPYVWIDGAFDYIHEIGDLAVVPLIVGDIPPEGCVIHVVVSKWSFITNKYEVVDFEYLPVPPSTRIDGKVYIDCWFTFLLTWGYGEYKVQATPWIPFNQVGSTRVFTNF
jgi:hypothetical protein